MPRPRKPARLWLEPARHHKGGGIRSPAVWCILDGGEKSSTGCGADDHAGAARALEAYLTRKHAEAEPEPHLPASKIAIPDVLRYYAEHAEVARPHELAGRCERLLAWWKDRPLSHVTGATCRAYAKHRGSGSGARRELEDFRAAIRLYQADGLCREEVLVTLPQKAQPRMAYFTRDQVAALIRHCRQAREVQNGVPTGRRPLLHLVPYILAAVYTGSRSARIWQATFERTPGHPWLDIDGGVYYRTPIGGVAAANKRAGAVRIPERLLAHLRRWRQGPIGRDGVRRPRRFLVEYRGKASNPKKALAKAMDDVFGQNHGFVAHTFRHTCATWLMWAGVDVGDIASYMSMTREVVVKVYGKEHPDADRTAGEAFSKGRAGRRKVGVPIRERETEGRRTKPNGTGGTNGHSEALADA